MTTLTGTPKQLVPKMFELDQSKKYDLKEHKEIRGLDANSYYWSLINQLAKKLNIGNEELHFNMLQDYSEVMLIPLLPEQSPQGYFKYYEKFKETTIADKEAIYYKVYKPSSEMNSKEFWVLTRGLEEECKLQGIETLEEKRLRKLIEEMEK